MNKEKDSTKKRYTLATRDINLESLVVTCIFIAIMIFWACITKDKRFLFIPLFFLVVCFTAFISLLFRYITEPKIVIQADYNGVYFYYRNRKEMFIDYKDIVDISHLGIRNKYGRIIITTNNGKYKSIRTRERIDELLSLIKQLWEAEDKEKFLLRKFCGVDNAKAKDIK